MFLAAAKVLVISCPNSWAICWGFRQFRAKWDIMKSSTQSREMEPKNNCCSTKAEADPKAVGLRTFDERLGLFIADKLGIEHSNKFEKGRVEENLAVQLVSGAAISLVSGWARLRSGSAL